MANAWCLKTDASQPIQIIADHLTVDQKNMVSTFTGNVIITQGSMNAHASLAQASQDSAGYKTIHMTGSPVTFSQLNDDGDKTEGQGNIFDYTTKNNLAVLTGRARVKKGDNLVMGDKLTYNTQTQVYSATSNNADGVSSKKSGRVTVILQPQKGNNNGVNSTLNFQ
jgi:lipopolysaccharide export system protein LptA